MLEGFLSILDDAGARPGAAAVFRTTLAGRSLCVRGEPTLLDALTASLHRREPVPGVDLDILAWAGDPSPIRQAPAEWQVSDRWGLRQPVRAADAAGMVYFDPIGQVVAIYDRIGRRGGMWVADAASLKPWIAAAPFLRLLDAWATEHDMVACHGAAIGRHGRAALIIGPGGAGKSTLALTAAREGFGYIGDDYVLLQPAAPTAIVHSMYSSGKLSEPSAASGVPSRLTVIRDADDALDKSILRVDHSAVLHAAPITVVVAPRIESAGRPAIEAIAPAEALRILLPSVLHQLPGDQQAKLACLRRVMTVPCVRLNLTRSYQDNLAVIDRLLAELVAPDGRAA